MIFKKADRRQLHTVIKYMDTKGGKFTARRANYKAEGLMEGVVSDLDGTSSGGLLLWPRARTGRGNQARRITGACRATTPGR